MSSQLKNSTSDYGIYLFHAEWCGPCKQFKPTWNKLTKRFDELGIKYGDYMDNRDDDKINNAGITAFPTVRIFKKKQDSSDIKVYDYEGPLTEKAVLEELLIGFYQ